LVVRIGVMAGITLLLVPLALSMRDDQPKVRASNLQGVDTVLVGKMPAPAPTAIALDTDAPTTLAPTPVPSPPSTEAIAVTVAATAAPTDPPTTAPKVKKAAAKATTTVAAVAKPVATQSADQACTTTYTVANGDAWSTIASRAGISMKVLLAANNATIKTVLLAGKSICLPAGATTPAPPTTKAPSTTQPKPATTQPKPATTQPATPPVTTPPATTQPPPPANTYTKAQVAQIIRDVWPDDLEDEAIRIATRESNLIPTVRNYCCYGLFQIYYSAHRTWLASMGITSAAQLYDPLTNATAAYALYRNSGWAPWATAPPTTTTVAA
jgi:LysM repeat protein